MNCYLKEKIHCEKHNNKFRNNNHDCHSHWCCRKMTFCILDYSGSWMAESVVNELSLQLSSQKFSHASSLLYASKNHASLLFVFSWKGRRQLSIYKCLIPPELLLLEYCEIHILVIIDLSLLVSGPSINLTV